jgi:hypothetical protein
METSRRKSLVLSSTSASHLRQQNILQQMGISERLLDRRDAKTPSSSCADENGDRSSHGNNDLGGTEFPMDKSPLFPSHEDSVIQTSATSGDRSLCSGTR